MASNLPPGCTSADGGIDHEFEAAIEKAVDALSSSDLTPTEIVVAVNMGIAAIRQAGPIVEESAKFARLDANMDRCGFLDEALNSGDGTYKP